MSARTMLEKIWSQHEVAQGPGGQSLIYIDRHLVHDGSFHPFEMISQQGRRVRRPELTFATPDHYVPTRNREAFIEDEEVRNKIERLESNTRAHGVLSFGMADRRQGIVHVIGPEQGLSLPGMTLVCGDSHTSTHGGVGALAFGIGASEVALVLATQTLWQKKPKSMRIRVEGKIPFGVSGKDIILAIIARIGAAGGAGHVLEYAGTAIRALSVEQRLTICNMSIEAGARAGMVAPDDTTFNYIMGRPFAPKDDLWEQALKSWRKLPSDDEAVFDRDVELDAAAIAPMVTWGTSPQDAAAISDFVPDPNKITDTSRRAAVQKALDYMDLIPGTALTDIRIDRAFIGSCTNSRIEDLRAAAQIARGRRALVPTLVSPGSGMIKAAAEAEGLDRVFMDAGFEWVGSGCSMCVGMNGDLVPAGMRCASTSNRNFEGRQGRGSRTHLMSPAMVAAAAVTGHLTDVRKLGV